MLPHWPIELSIHGEESIPPRTVFVVDDDEAVLNSLKFSLEIEGFKVRLFRSPSALLQVSSFPRFCCLVLDFKLPGQDGLRTLAALRERGLQLPAILITSHPPEEVRRRARAAEVMIVEKPHLSALADAIRAVLPIAAP